MRYKLFILFLMISLILVSGCVEQTDETEIEINNIVIENVMTSLKEEGAYENIGKVALGEVEETFEDFVSSGKIDLDSIDEEEFGMTVEFIIRDVIRDAIRDAIVNEFDDELTNEEIDEIIDIIIDNFKNDGTIEDTISQIRMEFVILKNERVIDLRFPESIIKENKDWLYNKVWEFTQDCRRGFYYYGGLKFEVNNECLIDMVPRNLYCENGNVVENCLKCGCPEDRQYIVEDDEYIEQYNQDHGTDFEGVGVDVELDSFCKVDGSCLLLEDDYRIFKKGGKFSGCGIGGTFTYIYPENQGEPGYVDFVLDSEKLITSADYESSSWYCNNKICEMGESFNLCPWDCPLVEEECTVDETRCMDDEYQKCNEDGTGWEITKICGYGCEDNKCKTGRHRIKEGERYKERYPDESSINIKLIDVGWAKESGFVIDDTPEGFVYGAVVTIDCEESRCSPREECSTEKPYTFCNEDGEFEFDCNKCDPKCDSKKSDVFNFVCDEYTGRCLKVCKDGTWPELCSDTKPYYCDPIFGLEKRCGSYGRQKGNCGCPSFKPECSTATGSCFTYDGKCVDENGDETRYGFCTKITPYYCSPTRGLIERCGRCGRCPDPEFPFCDATGGSCSECSGDGDCPQGYECLWDYEFDKHTGTWIGDKRFECKSPGIDGVSAW